MMQKLVDFNHDLIVYFDSYYRVPAGFQNSFALPDSIVRQKSVGIAKNLGVQTIEHLGLKKCLECEYNNYTEMLEDVKSELDRGQEPDKVNLEMQKSEELIMYRFAMQPELYCSYETPEIGPHWLTYESIEDENLSEIGLAARIGCGLNTAIVLSLFETDLLKKYQIGNADFNPTIFPYCRELIHIDKALSAVHFYQQMPKIEGNKTSKIIEDIWTHLSKKKVNINK